MAKIRVYELARELNCTNKTLIDVIKKLDIKVLSHMTSLEGEDVEKIKTTYLSNCEPTLHERMMELRSRTSSKKPLSKNIISTNTVANQNSQSIDEALPENHRIEIKDGEIGYTYENLFGKYLENSEKVVLEDKHIKSTHQIKNFVRFCGMLEKMGKIKTIELITGYNNEEQKSKAIHAFTDLKKSLETHDIELITEFDNKIHDRVIKSDDGWIIDLGKGLDIYKAPESWFELEADDYERRPCFATRINISRIKS